MRTYFVLTLLIFVTSRTIGQDVSLTTSDQAIAEMQNGHYQKALKLFDRAISENPTNADLINCRAFTKLKMNNYQGALSDANIAIKTDTSCSSCYETRAEIKYKLNDFKGCIKDYEKAFALQPILANGETYYDVAKSKLKLKPKPSIGQFQPSANFIEKIITSKLNFTDFYNQYYDNIISFTDGNYLAYNDKTKDHDLPEYNAEIIALYKGTKVYISLKSRTDIEPITEVTIRLVCICEWFKGWNDLKLIGYKEYRRSDEKGVLEIWASKQNLETKFVANTKKMERSIYIGYR